MTPAWRTVAAGELPDELVGWLCDAGGLLRVAVDGAECLHPDRLAQSLVEPLRAAGRDAHHVRACAFWHDASLRLEHGHEDPEAYLAWLDAAALQREVLDPAAARHRYLPSLRDVRSNRATRAEPRPLGPRAVVLVSGEFLLGRGLPFDRTVHLTAPPDALARRTSEDARWTLAAHAQYVQTAQPELTADVVIRSDRRHPVVRGLPC